MYWESKLAKALEHLDNPKNEHEVRDLFASLESDAIVVDEENGTELERVYLMLKEIGEEKIADEFIYPEYIKERERLEKGIGL
ncbi:hypothetical protein [Lagierella sp.]|uniref:hypothetical protein n=1 Tax=Lagierella sp. TaxID=2849657 RepID=UPI00260B4036|nr:hypothetical protein [Lagierella sp.]